MEIVPGVVRGADGVRPMTPEEASRAVDSAARAGARASSLGGNGQAAARAALVPWLRGSARIAAGGGAASVTVRMPLLLPRGVPYVFGDRIPRTVSRSAQLPVSEGTGF
jgi:hypothetical protein